MRKFILTLVGSLTLLSACNVLDQESEVLILNENAITDAASAESALNGLYDALQSGSLYGGRWAMASELLANNARAAAFQQFWAELDRGIVPTANAHVEDAYVAAYRAVVTANAILAAVPDLSGMTESEKGRLTGTAHFVRGLVFFELLRRHGEFWDQSSAFGVALPLVPATEIVEIPRSSVAETYTQIVSDLETAISSLSDQGDKFYASQGAAEAILARVRLYEGNYAEAERLATAVIDNGSYSLLADYNEVYTVENSAEAIFEIEFTLQDQNIWADDMYLTPPEVAVSTDLVSFFNARGEAERGLLFEDLGGIVRCTKYGNSPDADGENTLVARLSEMYLIRAEALAMQGATTDALPDLNELRNRAGMPDLSPASVSSESALVNTLLDERRAELAFEGHYWFDLVRLGQMESTLSLDAFRRILPIPQREMNITDGTMVQNPGYN